MEVVQMAKKKGNAPPPEWGEIPTPEGLDRYGALDVAYPREAPPGAVGLSMAWQIWLLRRSARDVNLRGFISVKRAPAGKRAPADKRTPADGGATFDLAVRQELHQASQKAIHVTEASISCAADRLSSPRAWDVTTRLERGGGGGDFADVSLRARGAVRDGRIEVSRSGRTSTRPVEGPVTSSWSLLEALGRLSGVGDGVIEFTLLDELDKVKPGQRLRFREATTIRFAGKPRRVDCYEHVGRGALPWTYYVDPACGLLLATSGLRACIRDAEAQKRFAGIVDRGRAGAGGAR